MSVNGPNKNLKLNIPFLDTFKKDLSSQIENFSSIMMQQFKNNVNNADAKGIELQQENAENYKYDYFENGRIRSKKLINPETKQITNEWTYDEFGILQSESIWTDDGVKSTVYDTNGNTEFYYDKDFKTLLSRINYDRKNRIIMETSYNEKSGLIEKDNVYDPETGKKIIENEYNPKVNYQLLWRHELDEKFPEAHFENIYDENNNRIQIKHYDSQMKLKDIISYTENPFIKNKEYFNDNGNSTKKVELIMGFEVNPLVTELSNNFSDENIKKINSDNVLDVLQHYEFRNVTLSDKMLKDPQLIDSLSVSDVSYSPNKEETNKTLLDKIFKNHNKTQKKAQLEHIVNALKEKFNLVKTNSAELYCNNKEAIDEGISYISNRLDQCVDMKLSDAKTTFEIAQNMLDNNDLFIDAANGKIDKINYQGETGDCWLLASLNGIAETPSGKDFISNCISVNPETGDVTVKLNGGKNEYLISHDELLKSGNLSKGDFDVRAMEIAFKRHYSGLTPPKSIDGGNAFEAFEVLTGETSSIQFPKSGLNNLSQNPDLKHKPLIIMAGNDALEELEKMQPNVVICTSAMTSEVTAHQYWIKIDGNNITVKEPHNTNNEKIYTREEFLEKFNGGLNVLIL